MPTLSADGDTVIYKVDGPTRIHCSGTFGSGTITWKFLGGDGSYHDIADGAFTAAADKLFSFIPSVTTQIKGTLAGSTTPSLFYAVENGEIVEV